MIHRLLQIGRWEVDFLFSEREYDEEKVLSYLYDMNASDVVIDELCSLMEEGVPNTGFTYASIGKKRALVVTGPSTSGREFVNTLSHEIRHLADYIGKSLGVKLDSETPAYITGDATMALFSIICELGCRCSMDK